MITLSEMKDVTGRYCYDCGAVAEVRLPEGPVNDQAYCINDARTHLTSRLRFVKRNMDETQSGDVYYSRSEEESTITHLLKLVNQA